MPFSDELVPVSVSYTSYHPVVVLFDRYKAARYEIWRNTMIQEEHRQCIRKLIRKGMLDRGVW